MPPLSSLRLARSLRLALLALALIAGSQLAVGGADAEQPDVQDVSIWRVFVDDQTDVEALANGAYDLVEGRGENYLLVVGEDGVAAQLRRDGFRVQRDRQLSPIKGVDGRLQTNGAFQAAASTFYGGYRTVDEHYAHLNQVASDHGGLATVYDYGDSWRKTSGAANPNELMVICLTAKQSGDCQLSPNSAKPRALVMAAIHARELQTSEVAYRLIDELTDLYGSDPEVTMIMDTTETWIVPVANPDGREIVESGGNSPYLQRKNANDTLGNCSEPPTASNHHGVDLNRNASAYNYGGTGTSTNPCAQTYRGSGPASEPEQAFLEALFRDLWPDQKGAPGDAVASTATGTMITMHSYGNLVLLPPGAGGTTPNDSELRHLAFRMSHYNGYRTGTGPEILYGVTGATDDFAYYDLGVASFTYELSPSSGSCSGFTPNYSCVDSSIWPTNRDALMYSLKVAGSPYVTPLGPTALSASTSASSVSQNDSITVSATVDDDALGTTGISRPGTQNVVAAEYYLDALPSAGGTPVAMSAADGSFNERSETAQATINASGLSVGQHTVYIRGRDAGGTWGAFTAVTFDVTEGGPTTTTTTTTQPTTTTTTTTTQPTTTTTTTEPSTTTTRRTNKNGKPIGPRPRP